ncbi:MAG: 2-oxoglutarate dehydrogenase E1 subunit family protein, partial [Candidatus Promineifilaceae bacterium]
MSNPLDVLRSTSAFSGGNATFVEDLYECYLKDPESIPIDWRQQFEQLPPTERADTPHEPIRQRFLHLVKERSSGVTAQEGLSPAAAEQQASVLRFING